MIKDRRIGSTVFFPERRFISSHSAHEIAKKIDGLGRLAAVFKDYCTRAAGKYDVAVGRYVIMPDHVHFFVRGNPDFVLSSWVGGLKRAMSVAGLNQSNGTHLPIQRKSLWQTGFFDHVLRNDESSAQKWEYVRENPVRAGLVTEWCEWPYQGEIGLIDRTLL